MRLTVLTILWSLLAAALLSACADDDDSSTDSGEADNDNVDDDDDNDDDANDDDADDDDADDDDDDDDDNDDDDDDNDDAYQGCDVFGAVTADGVYTEYIAGGRFNHTGVVVDGAGGMHVAAQMMNRLRLYHVPADGEATSELISPAADRFDLAIDGEDRLHLAYEAAMTGRLKYARQTTPGGAWATELITAQSRQGGSLAVEADGSAHLAYVDYRDDSLHYRTNRSGTWADVALAAAGEDYSPLPLAVDADGAAHLSNFYFDPWSRDGATLYWTNRSGSWVSEDLGAAGIADVHAVAADAGGAAHLLIGGGGVGYATNRGGAWTTTTVDAAASALYGALTLDAAGAAHVAYVDQHAAALVYADNASGEWVRQTVDSGEIGDVCDLALDAAGAPRFSYLAADNVALRVAADAGGAWESRELSHGCGQPGRNVRTAPDADGALHVVYQPLDSDRIVHLTNAGGAWDAETVVARQAGEDFTLASDRDGAFHLLYVDVADAALVQVVNDGDGWSAGEVLLDYHGYGSSPSAAFDQANAAHVSFYVAGELYYLTNEGGAWAATLVETDPDDNVGFESQLALAPDGAVHIVYLNEYKAQLKHATNATGEWRNEVVEEPVLSGANAPYLSLKIDAAGVLHLGYWSYGAGFPDSHVRYARRVGADWRRQTVSGLLAPGPETAMTLDQDAQPYFAYWTENSLMWAHKPGALWVRAPLPLPIVDDDRYGLTIDADGNAELVGPSYGVLWRARFPKDYPNTNRR